MRKNKYEWRYRMKKEKLSNIEFVRSVCAIIIVYFHFIAETGFVYGDDKYNILRYPCNGSWGGSLL